ncbi:hypothetical protein PQO03_00940 [Lentisphaera profundi]|uniref:VWFA domain-containing protein n=1 Tax=Lentisphaera profundi TaxID=1658616 RepID=A0ABY7VQR7_9BACT|nr:hypothetical protein [Lentisphaera profundi]WDE96531.1 hypothetical protein PQO03_00940 [Lentisphaera profundi]
MKDFLKIFYGNENTEKINSYDFSLSSLMPVWLFLLLAILIALYAFWSYSQESSEMNKKLKVMLVSLRFFIALIILLMFMQPQISMDTEESSRTVLPILIDVSSSMGIVESKSSAEYLKDMALICGLSENEIKSKTRIQLVQAMLNNKDLDMLNKLDEKYSLRLFAFDQDARQLKMGDELIELPKAEGEATSLSSAITYVEQSLRGLPIADMIIFTDGIHNKGNSALDLSAELNNKDIRIFPVGIGMPENVDVSIQSINMEDLLFIDDEVEVKVNFSASGIEDSSLRVRLKMGTKLMAEKNVRFSNGSFSESFVIKAEKKGDYQFSVEVDQYPDEFFSENNQLKKQVKVIDSEIRVLLALQNPSWEYRYLKGMLDSDKRFKTKVFIRTGDRSRTESDEQFLASFPLDKLDEVDIIILNNLERDYFSFEDMNLLQDFVSKQGGSLVMISSPTGTPASYVGTPIEEMLPVTIKAIEEQAEANKIRRARPFKLDLTAEGRESIITRLVPEEQENVKTWKKLPDQYWFYPGIRRLKPGATALVEHGSIKNEYGPIPLMSYHRFGDGQVLFLGFNSVWRWRYKVGSLYTDRFWSQTIHHMGLNHLLGSSKGVRIQTLKRDYSAGEKIEISAKVLSSALRTGNEKSIDVLAVEKSSGEEKNFRLAGRSEGLYSGHIVLAPGAWDIQIDDEKHRLNISKSRLEFEQISMDKSGLSKLAELTKGKFIEVKELMQVPDLMIEKPRTRRAVIESSLWDNWLFLLLISVLTASEWLLRKKENLP